jgi:hypothetical protein
MCCLFHFDSKCAQLTVLWGIRRGVRHTYLLPSWHCLPEAIHAEEPVGQEARRAEGQEAEMREGLLLL